MIKINMDFMDLLLAEALAAGMARQAAEARQRPPPDNFFILPPDPQVFYIFLMAAIPNITFFLPSRSERLGESFTKLAKKRTW